MHQCVDVKGMVQLAYKQANVPVGTADTWTMWVDPANQVVAKACDVVLMNGFPYWQGASIDQGLAKLKQGKMPPAYVPSGLVIDVISNLGHSQGCWILEAFCSWRDRMVRRSSVPEIQRSWLTCFLNTGLLRDLTLELPLPPRITFRLTGKLPPAGCRPSTILGTGSPLSMSPTRLAILSRALGLVSNIIISSLKTTC